MSYSRRQLYALGEPIGDSATRLKLGGRIYGDGGGGGGGGSSVPSSTTQTAELPEWARPYAKDVLAKGAALTDTKQHPYPVYGGERIAGFQPLQQQAFSTIGGLNAGPEGFQQQIGSYMSPYMQNAVDVEKKEAARQSQIQGQTQQAQAAQSGAFGGARDALQRSERERNLANLQSDIQAKGSQAAFEQGANQFRQGITQQSGLAQMQGQMGAQQQQQAQRPLDVAYQDFQNQQNYPYKQLGYMSDLIRGLPLGQQSTSQVYQGSGSTLGSLAGLGMGAYGLSKMGAFAEGGMAYADGGDVTNPANIAGILHKLSDQQLQQAKQTAEARKDVMEIQLIDAEMAQRASARQGIAPAITDQFADNMEQSMASGGITAFAGGDAVQSDTTQPSKSKTLPAAVQTAAPVIAQQTGSSLEDTQNTINQFMDMFQKNNAPELKRQQAVIDQMKPDSEGLKQQALAQALTQFGFSMAASAADPSKTTGNPFARLVQSAAQASPVIGNVQSELQKTLAAKQENYNKMQIDQMHYENQLQIGNMKDATLLAGQLRQAKQTDAQLNMQAQQLQATIEHQTATEGIQREQLGIERQKAAAYQPPETIQGLASAYMKNNPGMTFNQAMEKAAQTRFGTAADIRGDAAKQVALSTQLNKVDAMYPVALRTGNSQYAKDQRTAYENAVKREYDILQIPYPGQSGSISSALPGGAPGTPAAGWGQASVVGK